MMSIANFQLRNILNISVAKQFVCLFIYELFVCLFVYAQYAGLLTVTVYT